MKKILIDLSYVRTKPYSGVAKYAYRILDHIVESGRVDTYALILDNVSFNVIKKKYPQFESIVIGNQWISHIPIIRTIWLSLSFRKVVNNSIYDIVFCPWGNLITCLKNRKIVISVIHDLQAIIDWKGFSLEYSRWMFRRIIENSSLIVTISCFSKQQILSFYPNANVVNWGNSVSLPQKNVSFQRFPFHYVLFVGRLCKMKNIITLVKAYSRIVNKINGRKLLIVGQRNKYWNEEILPLIKAYQIEDKIVVLDSISEQQLSSLYRYADLFVFPSLREGFGSPPVEASLMCTPVLSTHEDSLEEVSLGLWYTYENPLDDEELASKMMDILQTPPTGEELNDIRDRMLANYSPNVVCRNICDNLEKMLKNA